MPAPFRSDGNAELFPTLHLGAASGGRGSAGDAGRRQTSSPALPAVIPSDRSVVDTAPGPAAKGQTARENAGQTAAKADATGNAGAAGLARRCSGSRAASHEHAQGRRRTGGRAKDARSEGPGRLRPAQSGKVSSGKAGTSQAVRPRTIGPRAVNRNGKRAGAASRGAHPDTKARHQGTRGWASRHSPATDKTGGCRR